MVQVPGVSHIDQRALHMIVTAGGNTEFRRGLVQFFLEMRPLDSQLAEESGGIH
jgi:hypothetical protein